MVDGVVTLRPPASGDVTVLVAGRDAEFHRYLGPGDPDPRPTAVIVVDGAVVGWVDWDDDRTWLEPGEVNVGYHVFAEHRGRRIATEAVALLVLDLDRQGRVATLLVDPANEPSLAVAAHLGFAAHGVVEGSHYFKATAATISGCRSPR